MLFNRVQLIYAAFVPVSVCNKAVSIRRKMIWAKIHRIVAGWF